MANDRFDIEIVHRNFRASFKDPADVLMDPYLDGFKELHKYEWNTQWETFVHFIVFLQIFPIDGSYIH